MNKLIPIILVLLFIIGQPKFKPIQETDDTYIGPLDNWPLFYDELNFIKYYTI